MLHSPPANMLRIGGASAMWGDSLFGARQLVERGEIDVLVGDYLAEVTMAILARMRAKDPAAGYVPDWGLAMQPLLAEIKRRGILLVTNAGGMNPRACRDAFVAMAATQGLGFRVAVVEGDDLLPREAELRALDPRGMDDDAPLPARLASANAYLGAGPIAAALDAGAEVVITGRCVDSALTLGALIHAFGWRADDYDRLAAGSLAGHLIECGCQVTGGLFTDWREVAESADGGWSDMGYPVLECRADGSVVVTKPAGTGGLIHRGAVAEQMLYEIGDPRAYLLPDVACDFSRVTIEQESPRRVRVAGATGRAPGNRLKVCATWPDGHRLLTTMMIAGWQAGAKAKRTGEAMIARARRLALAAGLGDFAETSVEVIGAGDTYGRFDPEAREVVMKLGLRHANPKALELLAREFALPGVAMAQGSTGAFAGRPTPQPVLRVHSFLLDKTAVTIRVEVDGEAIPYAMHDGDKLEIPPPCDDMPRAAAVPPSQTFEVPLRKLAWGRSGDKGNHANIGLIARRPEYAGIIKSQVTEDAVAACFDHYAPSRVTRWELPGILGFNFLLENVLGGGGTGSLRYDPQGKTYAQMLLDLPIRVPGGDDV